MDDIKSRKAMIIGLLALALPILVENIFQVSLGFIDTYFVSLLGDYAISGVGVSNLLMNLYIAFFQAVTIGSTAIISRQLGARNYEELESSIEQSLMVSFLLGLVLGGLSLVFSRKLLGLLGLQGEGLAYALAYFRWVAGPIVFLSLSTSLASILRATGDSKSPMLISLVTNLVNIGLNYVLMFGIFNFRGLGIVGIGLATSISRALSTYLLMVRLRGREELPLGPISGWAWNKGQVQAILRIGRPAGMEKIIMRMGQLIYGKFIIELGIKTYAAHNIAGQIESFSYLPGLAFGVAGASLIGQSLGSEDYRSARNYGWYSYILASLLMSFIGLVFFVFAPGLAGIFTEDGETIGQAVLALRMIGLFQPLLASTQVMATCLQGAGDTRFPMYLSLVGIWVFRVLGVLILRELGLLSLFGVWLMYIADISFRGLALIVRYNRGKWQDIKI